jgi:hypothetical protein
MVARENSSNDSEPSWFVSSWSNTFRAALFWSVEAAAAGLSGGIALPLVVPVVLVDVPLLPVAPLVPPVVPIVLPEGAAVLPGAACCDLPGDEVSCATATLIPPSPRTITA